MPDAEHELSGRRLLIGVTGGIAAYKIPDLVRLLMKAGAEVQVIMTPDAARFVAPLTLATVSRREVLVDIFAESGSQTAAGSWTRHVDLGLWAELFVIAPATAQTVAKMAGGFSDNMLTATVLSARCPVVVCPAMDHDMYVHPATHDNLDRLRSFGYEVIPPAHGALASGLIGHGRLPEPEELFDLISGRLRPGGGTLSGKHVLVTAGPTREAVDPVRFISNPSTGTMGYALAAAAAARGATVTLISGPTGLPAPPGTHRIEVTTAEEMRLAVQEQRGADIVIMAAAVSDYTPAQPARSKIKKKEDELILRLKKTIDILAGLGREKRPGQILIGFAMETEDAVANARRKLEEKNLDMVVLNELTEAGAGFGTTTNRVTLLFADGKEEALPLADKRVIAGQILDRVVGD